MSTEAQIKANQQNALLSTGPKTPEGKQASQANSLKHGLLAQSVLPDESLEDFEALMAAYRDEYDPKGITEIRLTEKIAFQDFRLRRVPRIEAGLYRDDVHALCPNVPFATAQTTLLLGQHDRNLDSVLRDLHVAANSVAFLKDSKNSAAFLKLSRYEAALERSFFRNLHALYERQNARKAGRAPIPPAQVDLNVTLQNGTGK